MKPGPARSRRSAGRPPVLRLLDDVALALHPRLLLLLLFLLGRLFAFAAAFRRRDRLGRFLRFLAARARGSARPRRRRRRASSRRPRALRPRPSVGFLAPDGVLPRRDLAAQLLPEVAPDLRHDLARVRAREVRLAQQRAVLAVVHGDLRALLADLAGDDRGQRQLLGDLREALVVVEQRARVREADFHLARFGEIVAVRLQDLHDLLAHQRFLDAVELRDADAFATRRRPSS